MVAADRGDKPRQGKRRGQASWGLTRHLRGLQCLQRERHKRRNAKT